MLDEERCESVCYVSLMHMSIPGTTESMLEKIERRKEQSDQHLRKWAMDNTGT